MPARPGKTAVELFDALASGEVRMVWIARITSPAIIVVGSVVADALELQRLAVAGELQVAAAH